MPVPQISFEGIGNLVNEFDRSRANAMQMRAARDQMAQQRQAQQWASQFNPEGMTRAQQLQSALQAGAVSPDRYFGHLPTQEMNEYQRAQVGMAEQAQAQEQQLAEQQGNAQVTWAMENLPNMTEKKARNMQRAGALPKMMEQWLSRGPNTELGKLKADLDAGFIDQRQYDEAASSVLSKDGNIKVVTQPDGSRRAFDAKDYSTMTSTLRKELTAQAKPYVEVRDAYRKVQSSAENPSPAGDLSLIFNYMKMLDPGSVVREGEFATAQNTAGVPDRVRNLYNQIIGGFRLNDEQRADFSGQAERIFQGQNEQYQALEQDYYGKAMRQGLDPQDVIVGRKAVPRGRRTQDEKGDQVPIPEAGTYQSPEDVKKALDARKIDEDTAKRILIEKFGFDE